ncbi:FHA domain-containing protein [bacterium]|nr:FHA domain-containing protein [bacterium]
MSVKIIVENDRSHLSSFEFVQNLITVGRAPGNDVVLPERNVSRHHFQLEILDDRIIIEDMGSYNSTVVNAKEIVRKTEMFPGDIIIVGDYNVYIDEEGWSGHVSGALVDNGPAAASENLLLLHNGPKGGNTVSLQALETVIGTHAGADVYLYDSDMPATHSKIIFDGNMYLYVKGDYKDERKLIVNDTDLDSIDMRNGDIIVVGSLEIEFIEKGEDFNPYSYLAAAEEERRQRLTQEIAEKQIRSVRERDEVTEITRQVKQAVAKTPKIIWIILGLLVAFAIGAAVALQFVDISMLTK